MLLPQPLHPHGVGGKVEIGLGRGIPNIPRAVARERKGNLQVFLIMLKHPGSLSSSLGIIVMLGGMACHALADEYCPWLFYQCLEEQREMLKEGHSTERVWGALDSRAARHWKRGAKKEIQIFSQPSWACTGLCSHSAAPLTALSRSCPNPFTPSPPSPRHPPLHTAGAHLLLRVSADEPGWFEKRLLLGQRRSKLPCASSSLHRLLTQTAINSYLC